MRASARIVAESDGRGGTRLAVLRGESPLLLRRTGGRGSGPGVTVHLVGGAAGPLRGDDLRLDVEVGAGAWLDVRSVAASLALPGSAGPPPSRLEIRATVATGAVLRWQPEPLIAAAGCDHVAVTDLRVDAGGTLVWRDDLVCGRHGEPAGDVRIDTAVRYAGRMLYRHELAVGPRAPGWSGPAVLGATSPAGKPDPATAPGAIGRPPPTTASAWPDPSGAPSRRGGTSDQAGAGRAVGSVILAGPDLPPTRVLGEDAVLMQLAGPGVLAMAVGTDIRQIRAALDPVSAFTPRPSTARHTDAPVGAALS
jgi:urease accessory protein